MANTTKLDAVNQILLAAGFSDVTAIGSLDESATAEDILDRVSREIQSKGLHCNTESEVELTPDGSNFINLTADMIRVDPSRSSGLSDDICVRNSKLYNLTDHTDQFTSPIKCDIIYLIDFEQLPEHVRRYVLVKATRQFVLKVTRDLDLWNALATEEVEAKEAYHVAEIENSDTNMLQGYPASQFLNRSPNSGYVLW